MSFQLDLYLFNEAGAREEELARVWAEGLCKRGKGVKVGVTYTEMD